MTAPRHLGLMIGEGHAGRTACVTFGEPLPCIAAVAEREGATVMAVRTVPFVIGKVYDYQLSSEGLPMIDIEPFAVGIGSELYRCSVVLRVPTSVVRSIAWGDFASEHFAQCQTWEKS